MLNYLILTFIAYCASLALTPVVRHLALRLGVVDMPGGRKIHRIAIPRLGGISVVLAVGLAILAAHGWELATHELTLDIEAWLPVFLGAATVFLIGVWDDLRPLPALLKLLFQATAAAIAIGSGIRIEYLSTLGGGTFDLGIFAIPITMLWIVGLTNAFNLIDGLDGLAAGLGFIAAATSATIFFIGGGMSDSLLLLLIFCGALAGFLHYNFYPAKIFLGDSGSQFIGYVLAITAVTGAQKGATALPVIIPLLVFGLPLLDTLLSIVRRAFTAPASRRHPLPSLRERIVSAKLIFKADRNHLHHRLLSMGFSHRSAVLTLYALAAALSLLAVISVIAHQRNSGAILLIVIVAMYLGVRKLGYEEIAFLRAATVLHWWERIMFKRLSFHAVLDLILIAAAFWIAFVLKYDGLWTAAAMRWYLVAFPCVLIIQMSVFFGLGFYQGVRRAMGINDLLSLSLTAAIAVVLSYIAAVIYDPPSGILAFFAINGLLLQVLLLGGRSAYRNLVHLGRRESVIEGAHVLIYGAGRRGASILQELMENRGLGLRPIGFLDDDRSLIGFMINRVRILGSSHDIASILNSQKVSGLIISSHKITAERLAYVMKLCSKQRIPVLRGEFQLDRVAGIRPSGAHDTSDQSAQIPASPDNIYASRYSSVKVISP